MYDWKGNVERCGVIYADGCMREFVDKKVNLNTCDVRNIIRTVFEAGAMIGKYHSQIERALNNMELNLENEQRG